MCSLVKCDTLHFTDLKSYLFVEEPVSLKFGPEMLFCYFNTSHHDKEVFLL